MRLVCSKWRCIRQNRRKILCSISALPSWIIWHEKCNWTFICNYEGIKWYYDITKLLSHGLLSKGQKRYFVHESRKSDNFCILEYVSKYICFEKVRFHTPPPPFSWDLHEALKIYLSNCLQVKHVDCYTITIHELESVTTRYKFKSMMRGNLSLSLYAHLYIYIFSFLTYQKNIFSILLSPVL